MPNGANRCCACVAQSERSLKLSPLLLVIQVTEIGRNWPDPA